MSNQLQENLDAILLDKNTNLKPENKSWRNNFRSNWYIYWRN